MNDFWFDHATSEKTYLKYLFGMSYRQPVMILMTALGLFMLIGIIKVSIFNPQDLEGLYFAIFFVVFTLLLLPMWLFFTAKKYYRTLFNGRAIQYRFSESEIQIGYQGNLRCIPVQNLVKIVEVRDWLIVYENRILMNAIPKAGFTPDQLAQFKNFLRSVPGLKTKLKG
ncbi:MAG: YcxB family protein [Bacteroidia bacterium]